MRENNDNGKLDLTEDGVLKVAGKKGVAISSGVYYLTGLETSGKAKINLVGNVSIFIAGEIKIAGQSTINSTGSAYDSVIFSNYKGTDTIAGQGQLNAIIYEPYKSINISGNSLSLTNVFGKDIKVTGSAIIKGVEYIEEEPPMMAAMHVMNTALPSEEFVLGEVYSFPNPAKLCNPTIHFECGVADIVEIRIYNIAAELVKSIEIIDSPQIINGKYAYEYTWDVNDVASGVYICLVRAHKDGKVLKKIKKMAVIR